MTVYASAQVHYCIRKGLSVLGFQKNSLRLVNVDEKGRLCLDHLQQLVGEDEQQGRCPIALVATVGTTNTGAVDPIGALAQFCREKDIWLHVDAAYGGFFNMTERGRGLFTGIEKADSLTLDPHKTLYMPYGVGALLVREGEKLVAAFSDTAEYLPDAHESRGSWDFKDHGVELTRDFKGLQIWLSLKTFGLQKFVDELDEKLDLALELKKQLKNEDDFSLLDHSPLTVVTFRHDRLTDRQVSELCRKVTERGRVYFTTTEVDGKVYWRVCPLHFRTKIEDVKLAVEEIKTVVRQILEKS